MREHQLLEVDSKVSRRLSRPWTKTVTDFLTWMTSDGVSWSMAYLSLKRRDSKYSSILTRTATGKLTSASSLALLATPSSDSIVSSSSSYTSTMITAFYISPKASTGFWGFGVLGFRV